MVQIYYHLPYFDAFLTFLCYSVYLLQIKKYFHIQENHNLECS